MAKLVISNSMNQSHEYEVISLDLFGVSVGDPGLYIKAKDKETIDKIIHEPYFPICSTLFGGKEFWVAIVDIRYDVACSYLKNGGMEFYVH